MKQKPNVNMELHGQYILNTLEANMLNGDAYISSDQLYRACCHTNKKLSLGCFKNDKAILLKNGYLHQEGQRLYLKRTWRYEEACAELLASLINDNNMKGPILPEILLCSGLELSAEQRKAVLMALSHRLSIILGGAGTGKTTLIQSLVRHKGEYLPGWVLCAPTGKAARNLTVRTGLQGRTVHSALGKIPDEDFLEPVMWPYTGLVVVDEASKFMDTNSVFCPECRNDVKYFVEEKIITSTLNNKSYKHEQKIALCAICGSEVYVGELNDANLISLYNTVRSDEDLISLEKILEIPKRYNMSEKSISLVLGWKEETFSRYCQGYLPNRQRSDILKRIYDDPQYFAGLLENSEKY